MNSGIAPSVEPNMPVCYVMCRSPNRIVIDHNHSAHFVPFHPLQLKPFRSTACLSHHYNSPAFAGSHGWQAVEECAAGVLRSLGARPSQPKRLLRRSRQGGHASARCRRRLKREHGWQAVGLHSERQCTRPMGRAPHNSVLSTQHFLIPLTPYPLPLTTSF